MQRWFVDANWKPRVKLGLCAYLLGCNLYSGPIQHEICQSRVENFQTCFLTCYHATCKGFWLSRINRPLPSLFEVAIFLWLEPLEDLQIHTSARIQSLSIKSLQTEHSATQITKFTLQKTTMAVEKSPIFNRKHRHLSFIVGFFSLGRYFASFRS